jgi:prepilin-type N-terminal cleavage/methylation domain-containing protein
MNKSGFTLIELLVVISVIGIMSLIVLVSLKEATSTARDMRRKAELSQMKKIFVSSCYVPDGGSGIYDLAALISELKEKYPQYNAQILATPMDPKIGTSENSYYKYIVSSDGKKCALYANLEREAEATTLSGITSADPSKGTGVFQAAANGWNGSKKYFQAGI